ncbi:MAG TPA: autotransporter-associated beta strand repeat-containing protein [Pirellulales bacterium]|nr:autotransporter-associated beta strand repeat-containing protein [Pirellulales bacterium]
MLATWIGGGPDNNWSDGANWVGGVAPTADDSIVFPATALSYTSVDDFAAGTRLRSITLEGSGYSITGNGVALLEGITAANTSGTNTLNFPLTLGASQTFVSGNSGATLALGSLATIDTGDLLVLTLDGAGNFNLAGSISDEGSLVKDGSGTAFISAANSYDGQTTVNAGAVNISNATALGSTAAGTVVSAGAALQVQSSSGITVNEPIAIAGQGIGTGTGSAGAQTYDSQVNNALYTGLGALRSVSGNNVWTGGIQLISTATFIGVDAGSTLNVSASISSQTPGAEIVGLTKVGAGDLILSGATDNLITGTTTAVQGTLELDKTGGAMPFHGALTIGDNLQGSEASVVELDAPNQLPYADFLGTTELMLTMNSSGYLNLNNYNATVGNMTLDLGQDYSAAIATGTGVLTLLGNMTVNANGGTNPITTPAITISGNLDLGNASDYFSGGGQEATHTFLINAGAIQTMDTAENPATGTVEGADLWISANVSGAADESITKTGTGTLRLTGNNSYLGSTIVTTGYVSIGSDTAFGAGTVSLAGGTIIGYGASPITISNPISLDSTTTFYGTTPLIFSGLATLTGNRTLDVVDPTETVTFSDGITESVFGNGIGLSLAKSGEGTLALTGTNTYSGSTVINADGGTIDLSGNGTLLNSTSITVGEDGNLVLDNSTTNLSSSTAGTTVVQGRINEYAAIMLSGGELLFIGNNGGASTQTLGVVSLTAGDTSTIASQLGTGAGSSASLLISAMTVTAGASVTFLGAGAALSNAALPAAGLNQIILTSVPTGTGALINGVLPFARVEDTTSGSADPLDLATYVPVEQGVAIVGLNNVTSTPGAMYIDGFSPSINGVATPTNISSNVYIAPGTTVNLNNLASLYPTGIVNVNSLVIGAGATIAGNVELNVNSGRIIFLDGASPSAISVSLLNLGATASAPGYVTTGPTTGAKIVATISSQIAGASTILVKEGGGELKLTNTNLYAGTTDITQGILDVSSSGALGGTTAAVVVRAGATLALDPGAGNTISIANKALTLDGLGFGDTGNSITGGTLELLSGAASWAGNVSLGGGIVDQAAVTGFAAVENAAFITTAAGTTLTLSGAISGTGVALEKMGTGTLIFGGVLANSYSGATFDNAGTLQLAKNTESGSDSGGITAINSTLYVGDDVGGAGAGVVQLLANNQIIDSTTIVINSSGLMDLNGYSDVINTLQLVEGPVSSAQVTTGAGTLTLDGGNLTSAANANVVTLQVLGAGNSTGATISGNLALDPYNYASTNPTREFLVSHGAAAVDLNISAAISNGTGLVNTTVIKAGLGTLKFSGGTSNTYNGTTEVNEGTLLLAKTGGALAMSGALTVGDGSLASGGVDSDVVRLLGDNQLPTASAAVTVESTGLLDLNGHTLTIGAEPGSTALTIDSGDVFLNNVDGNTATLILNGEVSVLDVNAPALIRGPGNLDLGSAPRTFTVSHVNFIYNDDLLISANIVSNVGGASADLTKNGAGYLELTGDNTYAGRTYVTFGGLTIGSSNALGTGDVYLGASLSGAVTVVADDGPQTVSNPVFMSNEVNFGLLGNIGAADSLAFSGAANITPATTNAGTTNTTFINVANASIVTFSGGIGDFSGIEALNKFGTGFLVLTGVNTYSGTTTVGGGSLVLSGGGMLVNSTSLIVNSGGTLELDNGQGIDGSAGQNWPDRINDTTTMLLAGGTFDYVGAPGAASSETLSTITVNTNSFATPTQAESTIELQVDPSVPGSSVSVTADALVRGAASTLASTSPAGAAQGATLNVVGAGAAVGSSNNQLLFNTTPVLTGNMLPWITLTTRGPSASTTVTTVDSATTAMLGAQSSIQSPTEITLTSGTTLTAAYAGTNLILSGPGTYALASSLSVDSLELTGGATLDTHGFTLTDFSGQVITGGTGNLIEDSTSTTGTLALGTAEGFIYTGSPLLEVPTASPNLTISAAITGSNSIHKERAGTLVLSGSNSGFSGAIDVDQGVLSAQNNSALGGALSSEVQTLTLLNATSGTFTLSFNGWTTSTLAYNATASQIQTALNNLISVGTAGGSIAVTLSGSSSAGNVYTLAFGGAFAGSSQPLITAASSLAGGIAAFAPSAAVGRLAAGGIGVLVANNAALQLAGGITIGRPVAAIGSGIAGTGAILNVSGSNLLESTVDLRSTSTTSAITDFIGVVSGSQLEIDGPVVTSANSGLAGSGTAVVANNLTKVGMGTLVLGGSLGNTISGTTTVSEGTLLLEKSAGVPALSGALVIGDNAGLGTDTVKFASPEQLAQTAAVTVNATGALDLLSTMTSPAANATQVVSVTGTAGTFTLTFNGHTTSALAFDATPAQVQTALNALSSISGSGSGLVSGMAGEYSVVFEQGLSTTTNVLTATGSGGATATVAVELAGSSGLAGTTSDTQLVDVGPTTGTFILTFGNETTTALSYNATPATVQAALQALSLIGAGNVIVSGAPGEYAITFVNYAAGVVPQLTTTSINVTAATEVVNGQTDSETVGSLTLVDGPASSAQIALSTGTVLQLNGSVTVNSLNTGDTVDSPSAVIGGFGNTAPGVLALNTELATSTATRFFTVGDSPVLDDLIINVPLTNGSSGQTGGLVETGAGRLVLDPTGTSSYSGGATVNSGELNVSNTTVTALNYNQQLVTVTASGGVFTLSFAGEASALLAAGSTSAGQVQNALNALASIAAVGGVSVTTSGTNGYLVSFNSATTQQPLIVANLASTLVQAATSQQTVSVSGASGTFTLSLAGQTTTPLEYNATVAQVQAALQALPGIGANVVVTGTVGSYTLSFIGGLVVNSTTQVTAIGSGGATATANAPTTNTTQVISVDDTGATFTLSFNGQTTVALPDGATAAQVAAALDALGSIAGSSVLVTANGTNTAYAVTFAGALGSAQQTPIVATLSDATVQSTTTTGGFAASQLITINATGGTYLLNYGSFGFTLSSSIAYNATASQLQSILNQLFAFDTVSTNVTVTGGAGVYTVNFQFVPMGLLGINPAGLVYASNSTALGASTSSTAVASGATLQLQGAAISGQWLLLYGTGIGGTGALRAYGDSMSLWSGVVSLDNSTIGTDAGSQLTLSGVISGSGFGITKILPGTLLLGGGSGDTAANTYTGTTTVNEGTLFLNKAGGTDALASGGSLVIGNDAGGSGSDQVILLGNNEIDPADSVTVDTTGLFSLNNNSQQLNAQTALTLEAGISASSEVSLGPDGTLTLGNSTTGAGSIIVNAELTATGAQATFSIGSPAATISGGSLVMGGSGTTGSRSITVNANAVHAIDDLVISSPITFPFLNAATVITKLGSGTLELTGNNANLAGAITVSAGTLAVGAGGNFGSGGTNNVLNLAGGTIRSDIPGVNTTIASNINLTASSTVGGFNPIIFGGVLTNSGGSFTLTNLDSGGLALGASGSSQAIGYSATAQTLTLNANFDAPINLVGTVTNLGSGATNDVLSKAGTGVLTISSASNAYYTSIVTAGVLVMANADAFGQSGTLPTTSVTISSNAEVDLEVPSGTTIPAYNWSITGVGFNGVPVGALRLRDNNPNAADSLTLTGAIVLGAGATIGVDAGPLNPANPVADDDNLVLAGAIPTQIISGAGGISKVGYGMLTIGGPASSPNTFNGASSVNQGEILMSSPSGFALGGWTASSPPPAATITVGDGGGLPGADILRYSTSAAYNDQLGGSDGTSTYTPNLVVGTSGLLDMTNGSGTSIGLNDTVGNVTLETGETESAELDLGGGSGSLNFGNLTVSAFGATDGNALPAYIEGSGASPSTLAAWNVTSIWTINDSLIPSANVDLLVTASLGGDATITQSLGAATPGTGGTVWLGSAADANFSGSYTVNAGLLDLVGATVVNAVVTVNTGGTVVADNNNTPYTGISPSLVGSAEELQALTSANNDYVPSRLGSSSSLNISGGTFIYEGASTSTTNTGSGSDTVPSVNLAANTQSVFDEVYNGEPLLLTIGILTQSNSGASVTFVTGASADAGVTPVDIAATGNNQLIVEDDNLLTAVMPFATIVNLAGQVSVVEIGGSDLTNLIAVPATDSSYYLANTPGSLASAPAGANVVVTVSQTLTSPAAPNLNSITLLGSGITIGGSGSISTTELINDGTGNTISVASLSYGGNLGQIFNAGTLALDTVITGSAGIVVASVSDTSISGTPEVTFGTPTVSGTSFSGTTVITGGVVDVQNAGAFGTQSSSTTIALGAQLQLDPGSGNTLAVTGTETLSINLNAGTLYSPLAPVIQNSGTTAWAGNVTWGGTPLVDVVTGALFNIGGTVSGGMTLIGGGTLEYGGTGAINNSTGTTTVDAGTLLLDKATVNAINSTLVIGNNVPGTTALVQYVPGAGPDQIANAAAVTININGTLDLNGINDTINSLTMDGGSVISSVAGGTLEINPAGGAALITYNAGTQDTISANLDLGGLLRTIAVADGVENDDLEITGVVSDGGINKIGAGGLLLSNSGNTYAGVNQQNTLTIPATITAASIELTVDGNPTNPISYTGHGMTAAQLQAAINSAGFGGPFSSFFNANDIVVSGPTTAGAFTLNFAGDFADEPVTVTEATLSSTGTGTISLAAATSGTSGGTIVNGGILDVGNNTALGTSVLTLTSGSLWADSTGSSSITLANPFVINGASLTFGGRRDFGGTNDLTLTTAASDTLQVATTTITVDDPETVVTLAGNISESTLNRGITKASNGTLILSGNNSYTGSTAVNAGVLQVASNTALGAVGQSAIQSISITGTSASFTLNFNGYGTSVVYNESAAQLANALNAATFASIGGSGGSVTVSKVATSATTEVFYITFGGSLANAALPAMTVSGLTGSGAAATVATLLPGEQGTAVASGAELDLVGNLTIGDEPLTISGEGFGGNITGVGAGAGALRNVSGTSTWGNGTTTFTLGPTTANLFTTLGTDSGQLTLDGSVMQAVTGDGLNKVGAGTLVYAGPSANGYTGQTTINDGTLTLAKTAPNSLQGPIVIGDNLPAGTAILQLASSEQLLDTAAVAINSTGQLNTTSSEATISANTLETVTVTGTTAGTFTLGFDGLTTVAITYNAPAGFVQSALDTMLGQVLPGAAVMVSANVIGTTSIYYVTFTGSLAGMNLPALTASTTGFSTGGVAVAVANPGDNAVQTLTVVGTSGQFSLTYNGQTTSPLSFGAPDNPADGTGDVQDALAALSTIGAGNVAVYGTTSGNVSIYTIEFVGALAGVNPVPIVANDVSLATLPNPVTTSAQSGNTKQTVEVTGSTGQFTLTYGGQTTSPLAYDATVSQVANALNTLSSIAGADGAAVVTSNTTTAGTTTATIYTIYITGIASPTLITATNLDVSVATPNTGIGTGVSSGNALMQTITVQATGGMFTLTYNGVTTTPLAYNAPATGTGSVQSALTGLSSVGSGNAAVSSTTTTTFGIPTTVYTVLFGGAIVASGGNGTTTFNVVPLLANSSNLVGGTASGSVAITSVGEGTGERIGAITMLAGQNSSASINLASGTYLSLGGNLTVNSMPGITSSGGASISGGTINLQPATAAGSVTRIVTIFDGPASADLTINSVIADGSSFGASLLEIGIGDGRLVLTGTNTYTGTTTLSSGELTVENSAALGGSQDNQVQGVAIAGTAGTFTITFAGQTTSALVFNATALQVQTALDALSTIGGVGGSVGVSLSGGTYGIVFQGALADADLPLITATATGGTTVSVNTAGTSLAGGGNQTATITAPTSGTFTLTFGGQTSSPLNFNATAAQVQDALNVLSSITSTGGSATVVGPYTIGSSTAEVYTVIFAGGTLGGQVLGALTSSGATIDATGSVFANGGGSAAAGTTVTAGAALELSGTNLNLSSEALTLSGSGIVAAGDTAQGTNVLGTGALHSLSGNNDIGGVITLGTTNVGIGVDSGTLTLGTISQAGNTGLGIVKLGAGSLDLAGATTNTMTGITTVNAGTLLLDKTGSANAVSGGTLVIGGDERGAADSAIVQVGPYSGSAQLPGTVVVGANGLLNMAPNDESNAFGVLDLTVGPTSSADVEVGLAMMTLGNSIFAVVNGGTSSASPPAVLNGVVSLNAASTITVFHGNQTPVELQIGAAITGGYGLTKAGYGTLSLTNSNLYTGGTTLDENSGTVVVAANSALGDGPATVDAGSTLAFSGGIAYSAAGSIAINGAGVTSAGAITRSGAIDNLGGANSFAGTVVLAAASSIGVSSGTLAIAGAISGAFPLTIDGSGTLITTGGISTSSTTVNNATLAGTGTITGPVTLASAGALEPGIEPAPGLLSTGALTLDSAGIFDEVLDGGTAGSGYSQTNVSGVVNLNGATLDATLGVFLPAAGASFTIISSTSPVVGTFDNLPQGAITSIGGIGFTVEYNDGGNNVVLVANSAPTLSGSASHAPILKNSTNNPGTLVSAIIASGLSITDPDPNAVQGIAVDGVDDSNGTWQFSINGGTNWTAFNSPRDFDAVLLAANAETLVRFVPDAGYIGTVSDGLMFRAWDQTSGINGGTADASNNGASTPFSSATASASILVDAAPVVVGAYVSGSAWSASYLSMLAANSLGDSTAGFELADGANQLTTIVPWTNVTQISIAFSEPVTLGQASLTLYNSANAAISSSNYSYDSSTFVATWQFSTALAANKYVINLAANSVSDTAGTELDGAWTTGVSTFANGSGDGTPGGDFNFYFDVLPGDANNSGTVTNGDVLDSKLQVGAVANAGNYRDDVNGAPNITNSDVLLEKLQVGSNINSFPTPQLPPQTEVADAITDDQPSVATFDAGTRTGEVVIVAAPAAYIVPVLLPAASLPPASQPAAEVIAAPGVSDTVPSMDTSVASTPILQPSQAPVTSVLTIGPSVASNSAVVSPAGSGVADPAAVTDVVFGASPGAATASASGSQATALELALNSLDPDLLPVLSLSVPIADEHFTAPTNTAPTNTAPTNTGPTSTGLAGTSATAASLLARDAIFSLDFEAADSSWTSDKPKAGRRMLSHQAATRPLWFDRAISQNAGR